ALLRLRPLPFRLQPALAKRLPARGPRRRALRVASTVDPPGDLGLPRPDDAGDDAVDARSRARPRPGTSSRRPDRSGAPFMMGPRRRGAMAGSWQGRRERPYRVDT